MTFNCLTSQLSITNLWFCAPDLRDDLQHGAVLWNPQQPGLLEVQPGLKDELAAAFLVLLFAFWFLKQELSLILLAGCS